MLVFADHNWVLSFFCILTLYKGMWYQEPGKWQLLLGIEGHLIIILQLLSLTVEGHGALKSQNNTEQFLYWNNFSPPQDS